MSDAQTTDFPLDSTAGAAGIHATEAFALLGNETRLAILLALWEAYEPGRDDNAVPFSKLYGRVEYDNPGNFSYHLEKLEGQFIRQQEKGEGYELRKAGLKLVQTVIGGAGVREAGFDPVKIDRPCWRCSAPTAVTYENGVLFQVCTDCEGVTTEHGTPEGFLNGMRLDPAGLQDRTPQELFAAAAVAAYRHMRTMLEGLCSACSGPVEATLDVCSEHDPDGICETCGRKPAFWAQFECRVCKDFHATTPEMLAMFHPATVAFYYDRGVSVQWHAESFETIERVLNLVSNHEMELTSSDPPHVTVTVPVDGAELRLTYDETVSVIDVTS